VYTLMVLAERFVSLLFASIFPYRKTYNLGGKTATLFGLLIKHAFQWDATYQYMRGFTVLQCRSIGFLFYFSINYSAWIDLIIIIFSTLFCSNKSPRDVLLHDDVDDDAGDADDDSEDNGFRCCFAAVYSVSLLVIICCLYFVIICIKILVLPAHCVIMVMMTEL
jgi:hypothetical protein